VGFRIVTRNPDALEWLIIQNTNAYEEGFTEAWAGLRNALWKNRTPETEQAVAGLLELDTIKAVYLHGHKHPDLISPDNWNMDFRFMERPNARRVQIHLFFDYRTNVALYPQWQKFLRESQPKHSSFGDRMTFSSLAHSRRRRSLSARLTASGDAPSRLRSLCGGGLS